jgi:hypothetical protein
MTGFNKHDIDNFLMNMWQKYTGDIRHSSKLQDDMNFFTRIALKVEPL